MYPQGSGKSQLDFSGVGCWLTTFAIVWLLGAAGLGWLVKSLAFLFVLLLVAPVVGFLGFRWWLQRNLVQGACPVCATPLTGLNKAQIACPNCGTALQVTPSGFQRFTPDGTVEVSAVEVTADGRDRASASDVVDVTVEVLPPVEDDRP